MAEGPTPFLRMIADPEGEGAEGPILDEAARRAFPGAEAARWLRVCRRLEDAGYGAAVNAAYRRYAPGCAELVGADAAIELADVVSIVAIKAGRAAAAATPPAAVEAARRIGDSVRFRSWLGLIQRFAALAPESIGDILARTDKLLSQLNVSRFEAWLLAGVRSGGGDPERRLRYFSMQDPEAERWLLRESGEVLFSDVDQRLKAYLIALWQIRAPVREPSPTAPEQSRRRASFHNGLIRMPATFPGFRGEQAEAQFRAALAHIGAHIVHTRRKFPLGQLKPLQVALVSLVEDARVEHLAMREFPGLRRLWLPFHVAQASGAMTAPSLLARLSRALLDPDFSDGNGWVQRGRDMFFERQDAWEDQDISRTIGNLLGNELGQMRVQFNPRTYMVNPPYRDDNLGVWDFGDPAGAELEDMDLLVESVQFDQREDMPPDREREEEAAAQDDLNRAAAVETQAEEGTPVARYPEYDHLLGRERAEWTTVVEYPARPGPTTAIDRLLEERHDLVDRIRKLIRAARVSRPQRRKRQPEGEAVDLDAAIEAMISLRAADVPDPRIYSRYERRYRDLSVSVLLDISESTKDRVRGSGLSVLDIEKQATVLLAQAMAGLGDPFAIAAFCSDGRDDVHYLRIKDFGRPYDAYSQACLAGLEGGLSTRIGAAMRHAGADLRQQATHRRLLMVVTDGEPSDIDVSDRQYLVEDARRAVMTLANDGIDVFCVGLDSGGDSYLSRIFNRRNVVQIDRLERLPERLPMIYLRLTA